MGLDLISEEKNEGVVTLPPRLGTCDRRRIFRDRRRGGGALGEWVQVLSTEHFDQYTLQWSPPSSPDGSCRASSSPFVSRGVNRRSGTGDPHSCSKVLETTVCPQGGLCRYYGVVGLSGTEHSRVLRTQITTNWDRRKF